MGTDRSPPNTPLGFPVSKAQPVRVNSKALGKINTDNSHNGRKTRFRSVVSGYVRSRVTDLRTETLGSSLVA